MRILAWFLFAGLIGLPIVAGTAAWLALEDRPSVSRTSRLTPAHVERARRLVDANDPRAAPAGAPRTVALSQDDVDVALDYLASRHANASARVVLRQGSAEVDASIGLPPNPLGRFLNVSAVLRETAALPRVESLRAGRLPVPDRLAGPLLRLALRRFDARGGAGIVGDTITNVRLADGRLALTYAWRADTTDRIRAAALSPEDGERLHAFQERLAALGRRYEAGEGVALSGLLSPLFDLAAQRGVSGDPVAENRAAILVAAFYVNRKGLAALVPAARDWPRPPPRRVVLAGREDFAQHFAISAALAAHAGTPLADAIGLYKEVDDMRRGSGFSFNDIAADRAGTRFGELAAGTRASAARLQRQLALGVSDADLLPAVSDLPEFMRQAEFERRYGGVGAPAYRRTMDDIERRIAALPLYR